MRVALATDVKDKDQFQMAISKAKQIPPRNKKNKFLEFHSMLSPLLPSYFIHINKKGKAKNAL